MDYQAYQWIIKHGGLESEDTYGSYRNLPGFCHFNQSNAWGQMSGFTNVSGVDAFNDALYNIGPLSVSIDASRPSFYFYAGGYYDDIECKSSIDDLDHSVLAVGVVKNNDEKFTLVCTL